MKWRIPAALLLVCSLALLFSFGKLQETTNDFTWMIAFSAILLSGFGTLFSAVWMLVALGQSNPHDPTHTRSLGETSSTAKTPSPVFEQNRLMSQSEFSRRWRETRQGVTYDENLKQRQLEGTQLPQRLKLPGDADNQLNTRKTNGGGLWPNGFRSIDDKKR
jgi:hypothetical protein